MALFATSATLIAFIETLLLDSVKFRRLCKIEKTNYEQQGAFLVKMFLLVDDFHQKYKKAKRFFKIK